MDCEHIKELLLSYIDNEIDDDERELVEVHLSGCTECTAEMEALAVTGSRLRQAYEAVAAGVSPSPGVWQVIKNRMETQQPTDELDASRAGSRWGWLFGWRHPVWRTAVAGAAMLSFMIAFAINSAPVSLWTTAEQRAIDIATSDPAVQALLDGEGMVYEVVPVNDDDGSEFYQVAFVSFDESPSRSLSGSASLEGGADSYDSYYQMGIFSSETTESLTDEVLIGSGSDVVLLLPDSGAKTYSNTLSVTPCLDTLNLRGDAIVDVSNNDVVLSHGVPVEIEDDCLSATQVQNAAQIAKADPRIGAEALVKNVSLLNDYDVDTGDFTDEMVIWVRLSLEGDIYFARVDLDEQKVGKLLKGGE